ncbi:MAG: phosphoglycerate mutase [Candidatus Roseilinea sp.]|nr:MAG: phosphoglycerate mutase [Candidatus Roseilinea sp.]
MPVDVPRSVWLVRHGQADWNVARRYMSFSDRPLTAFGERQAQALARLFAARKVDVIVHSGLTRAAATAQTIKGDRDIPVICDARWREASHGAWEGLTYREVMQRYPEGAAQRFADPVNASPLHGESLAELAARVRLAWKDLGTQCSGRRVVVVTHSGPIQALLCLLMGTPLAEHWRWRIDLGSATGLDCYPTTTILRAVNHTPPLPNPVTSPSPLAARSGA